MQNSWTRIPTALLKNLRRQLLISVNILVTYAGKIDEAKYL